MGPCDSEGSRKGRALGIHRLKGRCQPQTEPKLRFRVFGPLPFGHVYLLGFKL